MTSALSPGGTSPATCPTIFDAMELPSINVMSGASSCASMACRLRGRISMSTPMTRPLPNSLQRLAQKISEPPCATPVSMITWLHPVNDFLHPQNVFRQLDDRPPQPGECVGVFLIQPTLTHWWESSRQTPRRNKEAASDSHFGLAGQRARFGVNRDSHEVRLKNSVSETNPSQGESDFRRIVRIGDENQFQLSNARIVRGNDRYARAGNKTTLLGRIGINDESRWRALETVDQCHTLRARAPKGPSPSLHRDGTAGLPSAATSRPPCGRKLPAERVCPADAISQARGAGPSIRATGIALQRPAAAGRYETPPARTNARDTAG